MGSRPSTDQSDEPADPPRTDSTRIAVALSGGGYRAAAFCAGALLYLVDSGRAERIVAVSSVSGGSITNAYFARNVLSSSSATAGHPWDRSSFLLAFLAQRDILSIRRMLTLSILLAVPTAVATGLASQRQGSSTAMVVGVSIGTSVLACSLAILYWQLRRSLELATEWLLRLPDIAGNQPWRRPRSGKASFRRRTPRP